MQNWRPGAAERLKVAEADLRAINPDLVYASITGFGDDGPYADRRGYDPIFQALSGWVAAQLNPEVPIPDLVRNAFDPTRRRMSVVTAEHVLVKGAPDAVLPLCVEPTGPAHDAVAELSGRGLRVLAVARRT